MPTTTPPQVELWIRTLPAGAGEEHDDLRRRLAALERRGVIDSFEVRTWPHEIALDGPTEARDREIGDRVRRFRQWAAREGVTLPAFTERTTAGVGRMGPEYTALSLPQTALAVWRDGTLRWVAPCVEGGSEWTPREWTEAAAAGGAPGCESGPRIVV
jgi:hypothetical protein